MTIDQQSAEAAARACDPRACLETLCNNGFESDTAKAALALGRDEDQIEKMMSGEMPVDEDLDIKVHGLAQARGIELS